MPFPVGHSLAASALFVACDADGTLRARRRLLLAIFLANAPDLDFVPGVLLGDPNRFHQGLTHTILAALCCGLAAALLGSAGWVWPVRWRASTPSGRVLAGALLAATLWGSHLFLDAFAADFREPVGQQLLWPLTAAYYHGPDLFLNAAKSAGPASLFGFVGSMLNWHNVAAIGREVLIAGPLLGLAILSRRRS